MTTYPKSDPTQVMLITFKKKLVEINGIVRAYRIHPETQQLIPYYWYINTCGAPTYESESNIDELWVVKIFFESVTEQHFCVCNTQMGIATRLLYLLREDYLTLSINISDILF